MDINFLIFGHLGNLIFHTILTSKWCLFISLLAGIWEAEMIKQYICMLNLDIVNSFGGLAALYEMRVTVM